MRLITFLSLFVAALTGASLYLVSQQVQSTEAKLRELNRDIVKQEEAIHVLRAEWSYLNTPERLKKLAKEHTGLRPMDGTQIAEISTLPDRPPEPEAPEREPGAEGEVPVAPMAAAGDDAAEDGRVVTAALKMPPLPGRKPRAPAMPVKARTITADTPPVSTKAAAREKPERGPAPRSTERQFDMLLADLTGE